MPEPKQHTWKWQEGCDNSFRLTVTGVNLIGATFTMEVRDSQGGSSLLLRADDSCFDVVDDSSDGVVVRCSPPTTAGAVWAKGYGEVRAQPDDSEALPIVLAQGPVLLSQGTVETVS